mgnify:CR=1 FL=1
MDGVWRQAGTSDRRAFFRYDRFSEASDGRSTAYLDSNRASGCRTTVIFRPLGKS